MTGAYTELGKYRHLLSRQQVRTLKGQIRAGNEDAAMRGLYKLIKKKGINYGSKNVTNGAVR